MTKVTLSLFVASLIAVGLISAPAQALNIRSFISANGSDANACTRTAPCRTLQKAHDETNSGGEINLLDPADYGTVIISKAISIVNDGDFAGRTFERLLDRLSLSTIHLMN